MAKKKEKLPPLPKKNLENLKNVTFSEKGIFYLQKVFFLGEQFEVWQKC